jgi:predicted nucleic acid-binding protein
VKIVVDSNIIFSAILKYTGSIGDLLFNSEDIFSFHAPSYFQDEIEDHWSKLRSISKLSEEDLRQSQFRIY